MKSVGETMAIGRTFKEAFQKGLRGLEIGRMGFEKKAYPAMSREDILKEVALPRSGRVFLIRHALEKGISVNEIASATGIDSWFINNMKDILDFEATITPTILIADKDEPNGRFSRKPRVWVFPTCSSDGCLQSMT